MRPFHLAFPVTDLEAARRFYTEVLDADAGRGTTTWQDFDLYGHQLSAHRVTAMPPSAGVGDVEGVAVPIPHFGLVLPWHEWEALAARLTAIGADFLLPPMVRFAGASGEQGTFFISDPAGNALEFKAFRRPTEAFA
ncbi:VOC family protein [Alcanivorax sp. JB21]|uniref:VOC family protein n=1 Tax=Alcanivorax limicola TaxID=2874102 RepID=UPI001CBDDAB0|nr:VOC family protein [Alcanivorax limicola]MBZ2190343.1 VOC family protein [Alcanivorax limicola]